MKTNINFVKLRLPALIFSAVLILYGIWSICGPKSLNLGPFSPKGYNFGIDFQGGGVHQVMIYSGASQDEIRTIANQNGMGNEIQNVLVSENKRVGKSVNYVIKTAITPEDAKTMKEKNMTSSQFFDEKIKGFHKALAEKYGAEYVLTGDELAEAIAKFGDDGIPGEIEDKRTDDSRTVTNIVKMSQNIVSASQSTTLRWQSILLALFVVAVMLVYLSIRFRFEYGLGAVLSLIHDTLMMLGFISVAGIEFDMTVVAGILTFMGYTVNDTIVIYDRIRENHNIMKEASLNTVFNTSINQTINRSLITSFTTLLAVLALFFFAGEKLRGFSSIMIFGVIMGTYSSIFIASPIVLFWFKAFAKKENKKRATTDEFTQKKEETAENAEAVEENSKNDNSGSEAKLVLSKKQLKKIENMKKD